jgi:hypothetical protein
MNVVVFASLSSSTRIKGNRGKGGGGSFSKGASNGEEEGEEERALT